MEYDDKKIGCTGRCENCSVNQRTYCASQMAYYAQQEISEIKTTLMSLTKDRFEDSIVILREEESTDYVED
jgi:hypothetical protein